jgi:hypothetical protein
MLFRISRASGSNEELAETEPASSGMSVDPIVAERALLAELQQGTIAALSGTSTLSPLTFDGAVFERGADETTIRSPQTPVTVNIKLLTGGGRLIERVEPDEDRFSLRFSPAQVLEVFPTDIGTLGPEATDKLASTPAGKRRTTRAEREAEYLAWVEQHENRAAPSREQDKSQFPHLSREHLRGLRRKFAPEHWKKGGRPKASARSKNVAE